MVKKLKEAFAPIALLDKVHKIPVAHKIVTRCRKTNRPLARIIEAWALRYEIASIRAERDKDSWPDGAPLLRAKAAALREDVPQMFEDLSAGADSPPLKLLQELRELLGESGEPDLPCSRCAGNGVLIAQGGGESVCPDCYGVGVESE